MTSPTVSYIIAEHYPGHRPSDYVVAPPGYYWTPTGVRQDPPFSEPTPTGRTMGPEHGPRDRAFHFPTHRAAARVARLCPGTVIETATGEPTTRHRFRHRWPYRDIRGEIRCPCGTVTGRNLRGESAPIGPCGRCRDAGKTYIPGFSRSHLPADK